MLNEYDEDIQYFIPFMMFVVVLVAVMAIITVKASDTNINEIVERCQEEYGQHVKCVPKEDL